MLTGRNFRGFQSRCDKGWRRPSEAVSVARSGTLPAGVLEGADGFGLKAHSAPTCLDNSPTVILKQVCLFVSRHRICRGFWQIVLQKSQNAARLNFRQTTRQVSTADRCSLKRPLQLRDL